MAELRGLEYSRAELSREQSDDFDKLLSASAALEALLADLDEHSEHNLRNVLGAMRGYAELLCEDLTAIHSNLHAVLQRLLKAITSAASDNSALRSLQVVDEAESGTILAVDDTAENLDLLGRYLTRSGHRVLTASSGAQALELLEHNSIDTVLLDLIMPGMDGNEVLNRIKANAEWRAIPVIVISGRQDMEGIITCIEAGADDYLFKPFNPVLLQARIKAGLERKRWHDLEDQYRQQLERNEAFIRSTFGRYVSDEIVANLLEQPEGLSLGGDLREVTILMSDIRKFSTICENLAPENVMKLLNTYLGTMSDIIMAHQGTVDEFIGDGILAIFGAPISRDDDTERAVQCALEMQAAVATINREYVEAGLPEVTMGIGVNTGTVVAGNIGSEKRSKYGIVGHHVNLTARIEERTAGGEILVSQSTLEKLPTGFTTGRREQVKVKGINKSVDIIQITAAPVTGAVSDV
ncbi:adenylate/guanylate cyclase domain-containing response regulator [Halieaceae bacterium IMCC14734]|uniref:Adenylate/guanylate cyclase domain-containing response regulator n=2 Tax=Candidatus Litorirhabdus singularis TaxID=2518993 RepID=A0ABT3THH7_9GAMM|nr:adenylate/guanylate cyclase domain-containing response regulator [Candidatus Litorirhabdus singularis]